MPPGMVPRSWIVGVVWIFLIPLIAVVGRHAGTNSSPGVLKCSCIWVTQGSFFFNLKNKKKEKFRFFFFPAEIAGYLPLSILLSFTVRYTAAQNQDYVSQSPVHQDVTRTVDNGTWAESINITPRFVLFKARGISPFLSLLTYLLWGGMWKWWRAILGHGHKGGTHPRDHSTTDGRHLGCWWHHRSVPAYQLGLLYKKK